MITWRPSFDHSFLPPGFLTHTSGIHQWPQGEATSAGAMQQTGSARLCLFLTGTWSLVDGCSHRLPIMPSSYWAHPGAHDQIKTKALLNIKVWMGDDNCPFWRKMMDKLAWIVTGLSELIGLTSMRIIWLCSHIKCMGNIHLWMLMLGLNQAWEPFWTLNILHEFGPVKC